MIPVKFPGHNIVFGETQLQYQPLPALRLPDGTVITCWKLSDQEIQDIVQNRCFYLKQLTFGQQFQPIPPMANLGDGLELILP